MIILVTVEPGTVDVCALVENATQGEGWVLQIRKKHYENVKSLHRKYHSHQAHRQHQ
jgi:glycine cleavage system H lipoate-binding protein